MNSNSAATALGLGAFWQSVPAGVIAALVLLAGLSIGLFARFVGTRILERARFNEFCDRTGFSEFLRKGEVNYSPAKLVGVGVFWVLVLATLLWTLRLLDVEVAAALFGRIEAAFPALLTAGVIAVLGYQLVSFLSNVIRTIARNAAFPFADPLARIVKWVGVFLVLALAVEQMGVATQLIAATFQIVLAAVAFGVALAFGLGCKDLARAAMDKFLHHLKERHRNAKSDFEG